MTSHRSPLRTATMWRAPEPSPLLAKTMPFARTGEATVRSGMPRNAQVQFHLDRFTGSSREVVTLWVHRSSRYLAMIREVLRTRGLPEDLAFTAMIESGFKPDAVSRVGAKGMWQFMAGTARRYGLRRRSHTRLQNPGRGVRCRRAGGGTVVRTTAIQSSSGSSP